MAIAAAQMLRREQVLPDRGLIQQRVESLCLEGCQAVRESIVALEAGRLLPYTQGLSALERQQVLQELKAIMAVYSR